jgi:large conductance mechanosensitive channel
MANRQARARATGSVSSFANDFKEFLINGNVVDLAVAVVIGAAFGKIVSSLIDDIITPLLLNPALQAAKVDDIANLSYNGIKYGSFLGALINFVVIGLVLFSIVRVFERFKRTEAVEAEPTPTEKLDETISRLNDTIQSKL